MALWDINPKRQSSLMLFNSLFLKKPTLVDWFDRRERAGGDPRHGGGDTDPHRQPGMVSNKNYKVVFHKAEIRQKCVKIRQFMLLMQPNLNMFSA